MTGFVITVILILVPVFYQLNRNTQARIKQYVSDRDGEFIEVKRQTDILGRFNGGLELIYRDKKKNIRSCKIASGILGLTFGEDLILKDENSIFNYTRETGSVPVYSSDVKEVRTYKTPCGELSVELTSSDVEVGNRVFLNNQPAPDGKYKPGFLHYIYVKGGRVS